MSYNISSNNFSNPLLKELLEQLTAFFSSVGSEFYIIGATARDIILSGIHHQHAGRETDDLDIAIAIPNWSKYQEIAESLCLINGFSKSKEQKQRFWYKKVYMLDIVPFGEIAKSDNHIYWPPEETHAMSVHGFTEVVKNTLEITVDDTLNIRVASLPGIFILKLNAWNDRHILTDRDAEDMAFIIENYLSINDQRAAKEHYDLYVVTPFSEFIAGASLMGRDMKEILKNDVMILSLLHRILLDETNKNVDSVLINQILEKNKKLSYEDVYNGLLSLTNELKK